MIQLLAFHRQSAIKPSTVRAAYQGSTPESKIRKSAVKQFLCDVKAEEYEDSKGKESWIRQTELMENFGQDFVIASSELGGSDLAPPYMEGHKYMEVSTYKHDRSCEYSTCGWRWPEGRTTGSLRLPLQSCCTCLRGGGQEMLSLHVFQRSRSTLLRSDQVVELS